MEKDKLLEYKKFLLSLSESEKREHDLYLRDLSLGVRMGPPIGLPSLDKPWLKWYEESHIDLPVPEMSAFEYFKMITREFPDDVVLINYYGKTYKKNDIIAEVENNIKRFRKMGLKRGDVVSFVMLDVPEVVFLWYALTSIGVTANMIKFDESSERIKYMTDLTKSKYVFASSVPFIINNVNGALLSSDNIEKVIVVELTESLPKVLQGRMLFDQLQTSSAIKKKLQDNPKESINDKLKAIKQQLDELKKSKEQIKNIMSSDKRYETYQDWITKTPKDCEIIYEKNAGELTSAIVYTGGTTGQPKGVKLTNNNLNNMAHAVPQGDSTFCLGKSALNILPPAIAYYFNSIHGNLCSGVKVNLISHFTVEEYPYLIKKYKPNIFMAGPILLENIRKADSISDASFMEAAISGGDKLYEEEEIAWNEKYPLVHQGWGMSEGTAASTYAKTNCYKLGSVGVPLIKVTVSVFDYRTENELTYGQKGELCISGPTIMKGYFDNPTATENVLIKHSDGTVWLHTDDLGVMDSEGRVYHMGRAKRMLTRSGAKVWLNDIENLAAKCESIEKCCCVKKNDTLEREVPVLHIVLNNNDVDLKDLVSYLDELIGQNLNQSYVPKYYVFRDELPYSEVNKKCDIIVLENEDILSSDSFEKISDNIIKLKEGKILIRK